MVSLKANFPKPFSIIQNVSMPNQKVHNRSENKALSYSVDKVICI